MSISITVHNTERTPALQDYVEKRFAGLSKFTAGEPVIVVELSVTTAHHRQGDIFEAKVEVTTPLGKKYVAASEKADMYAAIDDVRNEIVRLLSSAKDKKETLFKRGAQKVKNILKGFHS